MRKNTIAIMGTLVLIGTTPVARAEIASREYVDNQMATKMNAMTVDTTPTAGSNNLVTSGGVASAITASAPVVDEEPTEESTNLVTSGGVYRSTEALYEISNAIASSTIATYGQQVKNGILTTNVNGNVRVSTGGVVSDGNISSDANIQLGKLAFPEPPAECDTHGCMLMRYNGKYVWELVARENGETISDTGGVGVTATENTRRDGGVIHPDDFRDMGGCEGGLHWVPGNICIDPHAYETGQG